MQYKPKFELESELELVLALGPEPGGPELWRESEPEH